MSNGSPLEQVLNSRPVLAATAVLGALLLLASAGLLFWGEHHALATAASLEQSAGAVVPIDPARVDPANDGKLVHLTGEAAAAALPADPDLGVSARALRLGRKVEVYQWKETKSESKKGDKKVVSYTYKQAWSPDKPAGGFAEPAGHANPADKPYADTAFNAADVKVGAFALAPRQVERLPADEDLPVTEAMLTSVPDALKGRAKATPDGLLFVAAEPGSTPDAPRVGDARVRFKVARPQTVTVVARQSGHALEPYRAAAGEDVDLIKPGAHTPQEMIAAAQSSGRVLNWLVRVAGVVVLALALFLVLRPLAALAFGAAPEGSAFNVAVALLAAAMAVPAALAVIGLRWLGHQPGAGAGLLAAGVVGLAGLVLATRARKSGPFAGLLGGGKTWSAGERDYFRRTALDPENAKLRLEFAALLEKRGDPLGEFIRVDHELEALPEGDPRREPLDNRWAALLQAHGGEWFRGLRQLRLEPKIMNIFFPSLWMTHGIVDTVAVDRPGILPERADRLLAAAPGLRVLEFNAGWTDASYKPDVPAIARLPQLEQVGSLKVSSLGLSADDLAALASSPHLKNLTELDFSYNRAGPEGAGQVARSATLQRLRVLRLRSCEVGEEGAAALARSANLARLVSLDLGGNGVGPRGAAVLATSLHLKNLQTLVLDDNAVGPAGAQALAGSAHLRKLTELDLSGNAIGPEGARALAGSANLAGVTVLKLSNNRLGGAGLRFLAASPHLGKLKVLELSINDIDDEGIAALAACPVIRQLTELSLGSNKIGDAGLRALAGWAGLAWVKKLTLYGNKVGAAGVGALAASPHLARLEELDLSDNEVGAAGARALADSPALGALQTVWARQAKLTPEAEQVLRKRFGDKAYLT
jgi:Ran GTPase-activating protein (RanGAP) involved in mRNA processing and transport